MNCSSWKRFSFDLGSDGYVTFDEFCQGFGNLITIENRHQQFSSPIDWFIELLAISDRGCITQEEVELECAGQSEAEEEEKFCNFPE